MNQKGITMATVVVMIIVMLIIATVSIVAGNKLIKDSKKYSKEQELESVKMAILRKKSEVNMGGSLLPIAESYIGIVDPIIKEDSDGTIVAKGWYLLDEENLEKLGIQDTTSRFIVQYEYEEVLATNTPEYIEDYFMIEFLHNNQNIGEVLHNKQTNEDLYNMVRNKETDEMFGTDWFLVKKSMFPIEEQKYINHSCLLNYKTGEHVKVTSDFEAVGNIVLE